MKSLKILSMFGFLSVSVLFLTGCSNQQINQQPPETKGIDPQSKETGSKKQEPQPLSLNDNKQNVYTDKKYNFSIDYPLDWTVHEDISLAGPIFRPNSLSLQNIQTEKFNKSNDCFFNVATLTRNSTYKERFGEISLGLNKFVPGKLGEKVMYIASVPKTDIDIFFEYVNNPSCKILVEESLKTLQFN